MEESRWRRNSLRLPMYDYADFGAVFVTICTHNRQHLFGTIEDEQVTLSAPGIAAECAWTTLPERFPHIELDAYVIMPDHLHAILIAPSSQSSEERRVQLGDVINSFKNRVLAAWRTGVRDGGWPRYREHVWQRAFHDRVLADYRDVEAMREYIAGNPVRWEQKRRGYE